MENKDIYDDISSIKTIMERSAKFISLSGLSGVLAGIYALIGSFIAYKIIPIYIFPQLFAYYATGKEMTLGMSYDTDFNYITVLIVIAIVVLLLSISTGILFSIRKAKHKGQKVWNESSRALLKNGLLPLLAGGCFVVILLMQHYYGIIAPACLIFYGLGLAAASKYTYGDVKWLGLSEIILGLICMLLPLYGLLFWALGFGVLHILYGTIMYYKYDRGNSAS